MKTYIQHLKSLKLGKIKNKEKIPVLRSSAVFPCILNKALNTKILFMGYWMIKKNIKIITMKYKLRDQYGKLLISETHKIDKIKAYTISIKDLISKKKLGINFLGSIEIEFLSKKDLFYPYPACVISLEYTNGSSFVHSIGRIYNNSIDEKENSKISAPESGFDILPSVNFLPFVSFVNGPKKLKKQKLKVKIINFKNEYFNKEIDLGDIKPFETKFIKIMNEDEKKFLTKYKGTAIIKHDLSGFYPRFLAGNCDLQQSQFSITHTFYDTKKIKEYFENKNKKKFFDATITVPIFKKKYQTEISLYPIFCPTNFKLNLELFKPNGIKIFEKKNFYKSKNNVLKFININQQLKKIDLTKLSESFFLARISFFSKTKIASRLKFGLNIISEKKLKAVSSNVCFNAQLAFDKKLNKKTRFCWAPIINKENYKFILYNSSFVKKGFKKASIQMNFWREKDQKNISKKLILNDNGSYLFSLNKNKEIKKFLNKKTGWVTFKSDNPFIQGYYIEASKKGNVGADHFF